MQTDPQRTAGILIPVFSTRHDHDFGIGDTLGLKHWIDWAARYGVGFIQLLPINENGSDESPYSAISSVALDPIYLTLDADEIPWLTPADFSQAQQKAAVLRDARQVQYPKVRQLKRNLVELAWSRFEDADTALSKEFASFRKREAKWLDDYCLFRLLMETHGESVTWDEWPASCRSPKQARDFIARLHRRDAAATDYRLGYFAFTQWLCFRQWRKLRAHADQAGVKLMGDLPIGVSRHSCDVFFNREDFDLRWCGGTPPEGYNPHNPFIHQWGQNWGIPLYRWDAMEANGYRWWHQRIRRLTELFSMFRLDHILGFYRIYAFPWTPSENHRFVNLSSYDAAHLTGGLLPRWWERPDDTPAHREANHKDGDRRLKAILSEIIDQEVIAEDLGWCPDYVRPHLAELGIAGFKIPHWDCEASGHPTPPQQFHYHSFAAYSTHDHDPINAVWKACTRTILQHQTEGHAHDQAAGACHTIRILSEFAGIEIKNDQSLPEFSESVRLRLIKALLSSNSKYVAFVVTELFNLDDRINEPGLHSDRNWTFRVPWTVAQMEADSRLHEICQKFSIAIALSKRNP